MTHKKCRIPFAQRKARLDKQRITDSMVRSGFVHPEGGHDETDGWYVHLHDEDFVVCYTGKGYYKTAAWQSNRRPRWEIKMHRGWAQVAAYYMGRKLTS